MSGLTSFHTHTNGKLLLSGEYFVLDGALALAVPTNKGQQLKVMPDAGSQTMQWSSFDQKGVQWFEATFGLPGLAIINSSEKEVAERLKRILTEGINLKKDDSAFSAGMTVETHLDFPREWGLGTSSTLIAGIASWMEVDAYELLWNSFGGSGYDIACALADGPLLYQLIHKRPVITPCGFDPVFKDQLYFVYLGKKQNSREGIQKYRSSGKVSAVLIDEISRLTKAFMNVKTMEDFEETIQSHENLISRELGLAKAKDLYFKTFPGAVKSLGAWGGDFVLVTSPMNQLETHQWFNSIGFPTVISYDEMVKTGGNAGY